jgi:hypothetical protein
MLQNTYRWEHCTKQVAWVLGVTQWKHCKSLMRICKHRATRYRLEILMESLNHKWFNKWCGSHQCTQNIKTRVRSKKTKNKWYKMVQPSRRPNYTFCWLHWKPYVDNSSCNCKNVRTTYNAGPTICVSSAKEGKTQVRHATIVGRRTWRWAKTNNGSPNGSLCHVPNSNKMIMRSPCQEAG